MNGESITTFGDSGWVQYVSPSWRGKELPRARLVHRAHSNSNQERPRTPQRSPQDFHPYPVHGYVRRCSVEPGARGRSGSYLEEVPGFAGRVERQRDPRMLHPAGNFDIDDSPPSTNSHVRFQPYTLTIPPDAFAYRPFTETDRCQHKETRTRWPLSTLLLLVIPVIGCCICLNMGEEHCKSCGEKIG